MRYEIAFGVGFDKAGKPIDPVHAAECVKLIISEACQRFGRCNITSSQGAWINPAGSLVVEDSRLLIVDTDSKSTTRLAAGHLREAKELAAYVARILEQEAVHFTQIVGVASNILTAGLQPTVKA